MQISGIIICKNEEKNIDRCIQSLLPICEEIIVVDSGSTDKTKELASAYDKVNFYEKNWMGYGQQKNYANSLANSSYILSLDADEVLSEKLIEEISEKKETLSGVYTINRLTNYCGHWIHYSDWFPDRQKRLFPKGFCQWSEQEVHETLVVPRDVEVSDLKNVAYHYSFPTIESHLETINKYSELGAINLIKKNKKMLFFGFLFNGFHRFIKAYVFKRGFLDGFPGFVVCALSGFAVSLKYLKASFKKKKIKNQDIHSYKS